MLGYQKIIIFSFIAAFLVSCTPKIDTEDTLKNDNVRVIKKVTKKKPTVKTETFGAWIVEVQNNGCYMYSFPISSSGFYLDRGIHYILVNDKREIMVLGGLSYKEKSTARIDLPEYSFLLITQGDKAWASNEDFIISKFLDNKNSIVFVDNRFQDIKVVGEKKEQSAIDKYTLQGFADAWKFMNYNCEVSPPKPKDNEDTKPSTKKNPEV